MQTNWLGGVCSPLLNHHLIQCGDTCYLAGLFCFVVVAFFFFFFMFYQNVNLHQGSWVDCGWSNFNGNSLVEMMRSGMCSVHWAKVAAPGYHDYLLLLSMLFL